MRGLLLVAAALALTLAPGAAGAAPTGVRVTLEPASVSLAVGDTFTVHALVRNKGATATAPLLAHLDVVSLEASVYVDPEDWSPSRSRSLPALAPGESTTVTWRVKAVSSGRFDVHVVVLPVLSGGAGPLAVSTPTYATVSARRTLNPGGSLGVVIGVPVLVGIGAVAAGLMPRRRRP
jgi:hypothetical protein